MENCCSNPILKWHCTQDSKSGVVDGRLRLHEVHTVFYLGCEYCSETLKTIDGGEVAEILTMSLTKG